MQESNGDKSNVSSYEDEDAAMMTRKYKSFLKKKNIRKDFKRGKKDDKKKEITCYKCKNLGHMKHKYSKVKEKKRFKKRVMKVT